MGEGGQVDELKIWNLHVFCSDFYRCTWMLFTIVSCHFQVIAQIKLIPLRIRILKPSDNKTNFFIQSIRNRCKKSNQKAIYTLFYPDAHMF